MANVRIATINGGETVLKGKRHRGIKSGPSGPTAHSGGNPRGVSSPTVKHTTGWCNSPGHATAADAGTVLIEFSPKEEFRKLTEIAEENFGRNA